MAEAELLTEPVGREPEPEPAGAVPPAADTADPEGGLTTTWP